MKRALFVRGGRPAHQPIETTEHFRSFLESEGYAISVFDSPKVYSDQEFMKSIDLIVQCIESEIDESSVQGLIQAVESGTGFIGWHGGVLVGFTQSESYYQLIGAKFIAHPGKPADMRTGREDDFFIPHTIEFTDLGRDHEITRGFQDFELTTEQYWLLADSYMNVLATTTQSSIAGNPWKSPVISPAIWTRLWGEGRIFICSPGHNLDVVTHPVITQIIRNGVIWATRSRK
jgi:type 1 glutamine amidotransferase